ncbi:HAD hydrolase family protein [Balneolales bacterium ANBcel1]|nr:HAD hydrolase family protein [Balneolales bacterium ANBcel1]
MIRYFILDLDGCLTIPFRSPDWPAVTRIRELQLQSRDTEHIPSLTLCTGRPLPYAEAVAQWLGIRDTIIFESGGGFYHPETNKLTWSPHYTEEIAKQSGELRKWFEREVFPRFPEVMHEYTKHTDIGMVHNDYGQIRKIYEIAREKVEAEYPALEVHHTEISVNVIVRACNKESGLRFFADEYGVSSGEIAYIGDSSGDLKALAWAGAAFAPSNAIPEVRRVAAVMSGEATRGVLEAYEQLIARNQKPDGKDQG